MAGHCSGFYHTHRDGSISSIAGSAQKAPPSRCSPPRCSQTDRPALELAPVAAEWPQEEVPDSARSSSRADSPVAAPSRAPSYPEPAQPEQKRKEQAPAERLQKAADSGLH